MAMRPNKIELEVVSLPNGERKLVAFTQETGLWPTERSIEQLCEKLRKELLKQSVITMPMHACRKNGTNVLLVALLGKVTYRSADRVKHCVRQVVDARHFYPLQPNPSPHKGLGPQPAPTIAAA
jgi:hypothetical protein